MSPLEKTLEKILNLRFLNAFDAGSTSVISGQVDYADAFKQSLAVDVPHGSVDKMAFEVSLERIAFEFGLGNQYGFCEFGSEELFEKIQELQLAEANALYAHFFTDKEWAEEDEDEDWPDDQFIFKKADSGERLKRGTLNMLLASAVNSWLNAEMGRLKAILWYKNTPAFWYQLAGIPISDESANETDSENDDFPFGSVTDREDEDSRVFSILR